jgi:4-hydroxybenzoate polyprenyltransferase
MLRALLKAMRPKQWTKNAFLFADIIFDRQLPNIFSAHPNYWPFIHTLAGCALFCLIASAVYLVNDIMDVESDRQHPQKKNRPIASGALPIPIAMIATAVLLIISFPLSYLLSPEFAIIAGVYFITNLAYSKWLKHIPLLDVIILASSYVLRVGAGVSLIHVERFSPWL